MPPVPFVDLQQQYQSIKTEIQSAINGVLDSSSYILGKPVADFERRFAQEHGVDHCVALSSGTDGNHLALWVLGVGVGDEVIVPADTFIASAWGATLCGARPVFVDCSPDNYNLDPAKIEQAITQRTKAIVAVHLYGQSADMDPILEIGKRRGIHVVEDCAQAHLAEYKGKKVGGFGITASWSFYPGKNLGAYGEGGAITTNDAEHARRARMIREHGSSQKYQHEYLGHNYRMEAIQGAVLGVKMKYLAKWTELRRKVASEYRRTLSGIGDLELPQEMGYGKHVYHLYVVQTEHRDALQKFLEEKGIGSGLHYPIPLHMQQCFKDYGYSAGDFPVTERLASRCLSLPMFPELTTAQIEHVAASIREFFASKTRI